MAQLDEGIKFLDSKLASIGKNYEINTEELETATGVGVVITEE